MEASALTFARAARALSQSARRQGLTAPTFASPPRVPGADRTLRRRSGGSVSVAVRIRGRPWSAVVSDMVEGVVAANGVVGVDADRLRRSLWDSLADDGLLPPADQAATVARLARVA